MSGHVPALEALGLDPGEVTRLARYLDEVARWNPRVNLTGARTPGDRVAQLVAPVLGARTFLSPGHLLDVGSGNGSPGLVLALVFPFLRVTLLEPRTKRWAFLREASRHLGLVGVDVQKVRHDSYVGPLAGTVTVRAVALGVAELEPVVAPGGRALIWRPEEAAAPGWRVLGRWDGGTALERST